MIEGGDTRSTPPGPVAMDADHITRTTRRPLETAGHLQRWLARTLGPGSNPVVSEVSSPESNGMSSETLLLTVRWNEERQPTERRLVVRIEPPSTAYPLFPTYDLGMQFRVLRLVAERTSVPVPEALWYEADPSVLGGAFFVMAQVDGQVPPDVLPYTFEGNWVYDADPADRRRLQRSAISAMAGIHTITPAGSISTSFDRPRRPEGAEGTSLHRWSPSGRSTATGWSGTLRRPSSPSASPGWRRTSQRQ